MATVVKIAGWTQLQANLRRFTSRYSERQRLTVRRTMQRVLDRAKDEFVPVDEQELKDSGKLLVSEKGFSATIVFSARHAIPVHEHLSQHSPYSWRVAESSGAGVRFHPAGRGPKYVEKPLMEEVPKLPKLMQDDLRVERVNI